MNLALLTDILWPLSHLLGAILALHAVTRITRTQSCIAWALALLGVPLIGIPLYVVFSQSRFYGYVNARKRTNQKFDSIYENSDFHESPLGALANIAPDKKKATAPFCTGNDLQLLINGEETFSAIFTAIDLATESILIQFYRVRDDDLGSRFAAALKNARKRGVDIYLLYDELGSSALNRSYIKDLQDHGIHISPFNAVKGLSRFFHINFRNHRKIVIIDNISAFIGGHNVGDEYLGHDPKLSPWRDSHLLVSGPMVKSARHIFSQDWYWATGSLLSEKSKTASAPAPVLEKKYTYPPLHNQLAAIIPTGPDDPLNTGLLLFLDLINRAKKRLWIVSPYFVPEESLEYALQLAALQGVDVRIMLPDRPDHLLVWLASYTYFEDGQKAGIKFYRYSGGFLHQKIVLVDDELAVIGTANLDSRSLRLNFEVSVIADSKALCAQIEDMLLKDFEQCTSVSAREYSGRSFFFRLACRISRLFSPLL